MEKIHCNKNTNHCCCRSFSCCFLSILYLKSIETNYHHHHQSIVCRLFAHIINCFIFLYVLPPVAYKGMILRSPAVAGELNISCTLSISICMALLARGIVSAYSSVTSAGLRRTGPRHTERLLERGRGEERKSDRERNRKAEKESEREAGESEKTEKRDERRRESVRKLLNTSPPT